MVKKITAIILDLSFCLLCGCSGSTPNSDSFARIQTEVGCGVTTYAVSQKGDSIVTMDGNTVCCNVEIFFPTAPDSNDIILEHYNVYYELVYDDDEQFRKFIKFEKA